VARNPGQAVDVVDEPVERRSRRAADVVHIVMVADDEPPGERLF
jgi:hypothetical protein